VGEEPVVAVELETLRERDARTDVEPVSVPARYPGVRQEVNRGA
jgi:hypothetical protein